MGAGTSTVKHVHVTNESLPAVEPALALLITGQLRSAAFVHADNMRTLSRSNPGVTVGVFVSVSPHAGDLDSTRGVRGCIVHIPCPKHWIAIVPP